MVENQNIFDGISGDSIVLNGDNISECSIQQHSSVITDRNYWHAFLIHNVTNPKRNETLKIILNYVYPEALLPIFFQSRGRDCIFLARNCSGAIFKLLKNNLVIPNPLDPLSTYTCEIILMYSSVSKFSFPPNNISKVLKFLFDDQSRMLNIEKFHDNKELAEYYPLSQPKLLCFVLRISDNMKPACINLKCNEIRTLSPFQVLQGSNSVEKLDLRYNLIEDLEELKYLKFFNLLELWLDGNPLCGKYDATSYIKSIKKILPTLEKLFFFDKGENARQAVENVNIFFGPDTVTANQAQFCLRRFRFDDFDVKDAPRTGKPVVENVDKIMDIVESDRHVSTVSIAEALKIGDW